MSAESLDTPEKLHVHSDGQLTGAARRYAKHLGDLDGVYRDHEAWSREVEARGADALAYQVDDHRYQEGSGALITGTSTVLPGRIGDEYAMTRGHIHAVSDRAELYYCLSGHGVMLLETISGRSEAVELRAGDAVNVPGEWIHRSVNVGSEPFVTLFCYAADAGQDYGVISDAGGMRRLIVDDGDGGWSVRDNPDHRGYGEASA